MDTNIDPFVDGNKRIGFMAAYIFHGINGYRLTALEEEAALHTIALAGGDVEKGPEGRARHFRADPALS